MVGWEHAGGDLVVCNCHKNAHNLGSRTSRDGGQQSWGDLAEICPDYNEKVWEDAEDCLEDVTSSKENGNAETFEENKVQR